MAKKVKKLKFRVGQRVVWSKGDKTYKFYKVGAKYPENGTYDLLSPLGYKFRNPVPEKELKPYKGK